MMGKQGEYNRKQGAMGKQVKYDGRTGLLVDAAEQEKMYKYQRSRPACVSGCRMYRTPKNQRLKGA